MSRKTQNHARAFNSVMHYANERWAAEVLGMQVNPENGIDLLGERADVEAKFTLINPRNYPQSWTVLEHQMVYQIDSKVQGKEAYWGLAKYWLRASVQDVNLQDIRGLEALVRKRELFIVQWGWMDLFPAHHTQGKTKLSEWNLCLRYPKLSQIPDITGRYKVRKGIVYLTEGVNPAHFPALKANA